MGKNKKNIKEKDTETDTDTDTDTSTDTDTQQKSKSGLMSKINKLSKKTKLYIVIVILLFCVAGYMWYKNKQNIPQVLSDKPAIPPVLQHLTDQAEQVN